MADRRLHEIATIVMGQSPSGDTCNVIGKGLPLLNGPTEFGPHSPTPVQFTIDVRKKANPGDLLFCVRGSTTGRMNWADQEYAIGRGVAAIRHNKGLQFQPFLRAVIEHNLPSLLQAATGSTFPNVSAAQLSGLTFPDISEEKQLKISSLLGALDDKINLNRRTNETLEAMARAIFKDWFVDFGPVRAKAEARQPPGLSPEIAALFPDALDDDDKPVGWEVIPIAEMIEIIGGGTPKTSVANYWGGNIPWFSVVDAPALSDVFVIDTEKHITENGLNNSSARMLPEGATIVTARGTVGKLACVAVPMAMNQSCYAIIGKPPLGSYFTYFMLRGTVQGLQANTHGSVFDTITRSTFSAVGGIRPNDRLAQMFDEVVGPLMARILSNLRESTTLAQLRDLLLPKLMSGEIRLKDAEKAVEQVA